jgi:hypothetical protein
MSRRARERRQPEIAGDEPEELRKAFAAAERLEKFREIYEMLNERDAEHERDAFEGQDQSIRRAV